MSSVLSRKFERSNALNGATFDRELAPLDLADGIVVNKDRSLGYGFRVQAPYTPTMGDQAIAGNYERLSGFLDSLPAHFDLQVIWTQHSRAREFESRLEALPFTPGLVGEVQREQQDNLRTLLREGHLRWIEVYFLLVRKPTGGERARGQRRPGGWRGRSRTVERLFAGADEELRYSEEAFRAASGELLTQARALAGALEPLGWMPTPLQNEDVLRLYFQRWNPRQFEGGASARPYRPQSGVPFTERFAHSNFRIDPTGRTVPAGIAELDEWFHAILTLHGPPEEMARPVFDELLLLSGLFRAELVVNVERGDRVKRIKRLKTLLQQRRSEPTVAEDPTERAATRELEEELEGMGANAEATWRAACYLHLWAPTPEELRERMTAALAAARSRDMVFVVEKHALWPYWRAMQPFWTQDHDRYRLLDYSTRQLVRLLPLCGQPTNLSADKAIGVLYQTASRSIFNWIAPDETLFANPHYLTIGGTGSGKSVLEDENLIAMRRRHARSIIIDLGGSFANFCAASGGVYVDYNLKARTNRLNPLWLPPGTVPDPEVLRSRTLWLESLLTERGERLSADHMVLVEAALRRSYFRDLQAPVFLRHVRAALQRDERSAILAHRLSPWCEDGSFAALFDGPAQIDLHAPVVVFDLKHVVNDQRDADLARIIFGSIVSAVTSLALESSPHPKTLTIDEAGLQLKDEATADFLEYCMRTLRKAGVSVRALSHGIEDFLVNTKARNAFVGAADNLFILKQDSFDKARMVAEELALSPRELKLLQAVTTVPGSHAEFALVQKTNYGQRTLHLLSASTPLKYAFTCNSADDRREIERYLQDGLSRPDALRRFAREHPVGLRSARVPAL